MVKCNAVLKAFQRWCCPLRNVKSPKVLYLFNNFEAVFVLLQMAKFCAPDIGKKPYFSNITLYATVPFKWLPLWIIDYQFAMVEVSWFQSLNFNNTPSLLRTKKFTIFYRSPFNEVLYDWSYCCQNTIITLQHFVMFSLDIS